MYAEDLPDGARLWRAFTTRAALGHGRGDGPWRFDAQEQVLRYDAPDGVQLRMQRLYGSRFVLWGRVPGDAPQPDWTGVPGWASSEAVHRWFARVGATFMAWHHRDGWDTATPEADLARAVGPLLADDLPAEVAGSEPGVDAFEELLKEDGDAAAAWAVVVGAGADGPPARGRVRTLLTAEIRAQMQLTRDRERILPGRPVAVVRWTRVAAPPPGFRFGMHLERDALVEAPDNDELSEQFRSSLVNVLTQLHHEEADAQWGSWLFARIRYDGVNVHFDRAFDGRPSWYPHQGPSLGTLASEMSRRTPEWRPAWSRLLPDLPAVLD